MSRPRAHTGTLIAGVLLLATACSRGADPSALARLDSADPLREAMHELTSTMVYDIVSPPQASRTYSYASIAAYEVLRHGDTTWRSLAGQVGKMPVPPAPLPDATYAWSLAGVHAFLSVARQLTFSRARMDSVRTAFDARWQQAGVPRDVWERSIAYGDSVAAHVLRWAGKDGFKESRGMPKFSVTSNPARWAPTPPAYMDAVEPNWGTLRPFVMDSGSQFRPAPAVPFDSTPGSAFHRHALEVYETGRQLTEEQRAIASFWDCNPYVMNVQGHTAFATKKITPGGHWMGIATLITAQRRSTLLETADTYARTAMALADAFIAAWEEKFRSGVIRPETAINAYIDERWTPLLQTPPFPEYPSGHSVISTSAAQVLTALYGDSLAFTDSTEVPFGLPARRFTSFKAAAAEAAISRLYGGIHFRPAIEEGQRQGAQVGSLLVARVVTRPSGRMAAR